MSPNARDRVCAALQWDPSDASIEVNTLVTLPHSFVASVRRGDAATMLFKQAGGSDFAPGLRKELLVNRDVLKRLPTPVAPTYLAGDETAEMPWILFENLTASHQTIPVHPAPRPYIEKFVSALARTHAQARALPLADLFRNVDGDVHITDGGDQVAGVLDAFLHAVDDDRFPARSYELVRKIRDNIPMVRTLLTGDETLVHGDAHFDNAMYDDEGALLIDWALAVMGPGEVDLAHALAMNLPRFFSAEYEASLFLCYAEQASAHGHSVSENEVRDRYRQCLLLTVIIAVGMHTVPGMTDRVWSFLFTNAVHSALDHDALGLLN